MEHFFQVFPSPKHTRLVTPNLRDQRESGGGVKTHSNPSPPMFMYGRDAQLTHPTHLPEKIRACMLVTR